MEFIENCLVSVVNTLSPPFKVTIKVDRIFNHEHVWSVGLIRRAPMKELISIEIDFTVLSMLLTFRIKNYDPY